MRRLFFSAGAWCILGALQLLTFQSSYAQDVKTDTIKWKLSIPVTAADSTTALYDSYLITYGDTKAEWQHKWIGKSGETDLKLSEMDITGVTGNWQNINVDGEILYNVALANGTGTLSFKRTTGNYQLLMILTGRNGGTTHRDFTIINVAH